MLSIVRKIRYFWDIRNKFDFEPAFKKLYVTVLEMGDSLCVSLLSPLSFTCISYLSPYLSLYLPPICLFLSITQMIFLPPWLPSFKFCVFAIYVSYAYIYLPTYLDAEEAFLLLLFYYYCYYFYFFLLLTINYAKFILTLAYLT